MTIKTTHRYDDIIDLPHPVSGRHPAMSMYDRAAQFSPFAALTGYEDLLEETGRLTDADTELTESAIETIDRTIHFLQEHCDAPHKITVTYYQPDRRKTGGSFVTVTGSCKKVLSYERRLVLSDGTVIPIDQIKSLFAELI